MTAREMRFEYERKILALKAKLRDSDYQAIKFAEGELSITEFSPILAQRREWRAEINLLEEKVRELPNGGR